MEIEGCEKKKKNPVLIIKGSVCAIGREPPKIPGQGCTRPHFFSPHTLPTLFPSGPVGLQIPERVGCGSQMALPLALCLSTPLCTPWWNSDQPNYHCCLQQLFLDRADIPYYKKKKSRKKVRKHLKSLQSFSPWQWVFLFHVRESGLGLEGKGSRACHQSN